MTEMNHTYSSFIANNSLFIMTFFLFIVILVALGYIYEYLHIQLCAGAHGYIFIQTADDSQGLYITRLITCLILHSK